MGLRVQRPALQGSVEIPLDPLLGSLAPNGGPTRTHALLSGSKAVDKGTGATSASFFCKSASNRDPRSMTPKPLNSRAFSTPWWGHDWTPIVSL